MELAFSSHSISGGTHLLYQHRGGGVIKVPSCSVVLGILETLGGSTQLEEDHWVLRRILPHPPISSALCFCLLGDEKAPRHRLLSPRCSVQAHGDSNCGWGPLTL